jgi:hypothetical protein
MTQERKVDAMTKIGNKPAKMRSDEYVDSLINSPFDGMRMWAHGYDDDGGLGATDDEVVTNIAGVLRKAHELVAFAKAYGYRTGVLDDRDPLTPRAIRRIAARLAQEGGK